MISLIILNWARPRNLPLITSHLKKSLPISETFWVNNNPIQRLDCPPDTTLVNHSRDLGLWTRFTTAALAKNEHILLHDDDVLVEPQNLRKMWKAYQEDQCLVNHGIVGRNCGESYTYKDNAKHACEILLTHCVFTSKARCIRALAKAHEFDMAMPNANPRGNGEDILLSFTGRNYSWDLTRTLPNDGNAIHGRNGHKEHRTRALNWCRSQKDMFANQYPFKTKST